MIELIESVPRKVGQEKIYLQQSLNDTVGPEMFKDFKLLAWDKLDIIQVSFNEYPDLHIFILWQDINKTFS